MTDTINDVKIKVKGKNRATLAFVLSLISLVGIGYLYYTGLKVHAHTVYQLQSLDTDIQNNTTKVDGMVSDFSHQIGELNGKINSVSANRVTATNYQLNSLVSLANQSLVAYHDVNAAIKLLNYAQNVLTGNDNAIYTELKSAIAADLDRLNQLPALDRVVIAADLNNILLATDKLELLVVNSNRINVTEAPNKDSKWQEFASNIKSKLFGLVQISKTKNNDALNLLPQNEVIIHQNIKLNILNARMALLQNDAKNWQYSLNEVKNILSTYFVNNSMTDGITKNIDKLGQIDISVDGINIDQTLKALNKFNNLSSDIPIK